ncbi:C1 family peptidase [uncultured Methanobrevibacter sp.]|uniref:C1 family peptidase n=1 Tax=uncultured Methanobrevibacter sp. TaxID=253161 RepID=UPI0025D4775D|nr:C1 family peptidase [uncultured Methanobrevibacter sp.]
MNDFGGALITNSNSTITNCTFKNNRGRYGGAVSIADNKSCLFIDCKFINNAASLGGGAIYTWNGEGIFEQCVFSNCTSQFGGAIFSLNGNLALDNDIFHDNQAFAFGGGIYKKWGNLSIYKGNYANNSAYYDRGAVYIINGTSSIDGALFEENFANYGGDSIHSISTALNLHEPLFENATGKTTIETKYINPFIDLGNYTMIVSKISHDLEKMPSSFNLADHGWVTSVKSQGHTGLCWDFAAIAVVESAVKKATGKELDLSENHLKNMIAEYSSYGWDRDPNEGGSKWTSFPYFINALGPVLEATEPLKTFGFSPLLENVLLVSNIVNLSRDRDFPLDNSHIKQAIMDYGAIRASMNADYHNGYNYYSYKETTTNHAVAIVGWDDNYDKKKFGNNCPENGAWIAKNSWGKNSGKDGYIYISYYDKSFAYEDLIYVVFNNTMKFDRIYQYDYGLYRDEICPDSYVAYKNVYTSINDEDIGAVSTFFYGNTNWTVSVYVGDKLQHKQSGWTEDVGYFTINLDKQIRVKKGQNFSVAIEVNKKIMPCVNKDLNSLTCGKGASYVYLSSSKKWTGLNDQKTPCVAIIKVYTINKASEDVIYPLDNVIYGSPVNVTFDTENRTAINYLLKKDGEIISSMEDINGNEIILPDLEIGNYEITINFIGTESNKSVSYCANFTVNKIPSLIEIEDISPIIYGNNLTVNFNTSNISNNIFTYRVAYDGLRKVMNETYISNGTNNSITLPTLDAGDYTITIYTGGDDMNANSSASHNFTISKITPTVTIDICKENSEGELKFNVTSDVRESYLIRIGEKGRFVGFTRADSKICTLNDIPDGNYTLSLESTGTLNLNKVKKLYNVTVDRTASIFTMQPVE